jgi:hypothetical protein
MQPASAPQEPDSAAKQTAPGQSTTPKERRAVGSRAKKKGKKTAEVAKDAKDQDADAQPDAEPTSIQVIKQEVEGAAKGSQEYMRDAGENLKAYADSHLDQLKEDLEPVTKHLPEPVQNALDRGGWWGIIGVLGLFALLWLRWLVRKLGGAVSRPKHKKKRGMKSVPMNLKENLRQLGEAYTEEGPQRLTVKGLPARLRLVILSLGTRNAGELSEEMVDRVLDWIKPGLAEVTASDYPRVRVWPLFYGLDGFANGFATNVPIPELKGEKSRWVLVCGQVKMGRAIIHVGLGLFADEPNTLRCIKVKGERWLNVLGVKETRRPVGAR